MERLPYDIWFIIFELACTDGGRTGCALAQTSKAFRKASAHARLLSVALRSVLQVQHFLVCVERMRRSSGPAPSIRHLLLSFLPHTSDAPLRALSRCPDFARGELDVITQLANHRRLWEAGKAAWNREFVLHVSRLLQLAAPTLITLAVLQSREVRLPLVQYRPFPALRELTLLGDDRTFVRLARPGLLIPGESEEFDFNLYGVGVPAAQSAPFPALRRLHLVFAFPKLHPWQQTLPEWAARAPALSHLRISQGTGQVQDMLRRMLGRPPSTPAPPSHAAPALSDGEGAPRRRSPDRESDPSEFDPAYYPSLRRVVVQMGYGSASSSRSEAMNEVLILQRKVERIAAECVDRGYTEAAISVLPSRLCEDEYWPQRLAWEWQDRMAGGPGCWAEDEEGGDEKRYEDFGNASLSFAEADAYRAKWWKVMFTKAK
ncbi:hypothetical protein BD413DRAFT_493675 [Trametes elegans]|nr:hypothetical protein BD413DRAFT_493675 [Trametes elegans]